MQTEQESKKTIFKLVFHAEDCVDDLDAEKFAEYKDGRMAVTEIHSINFKKYSVILFRLKTPQRNTAVEKFIRSELVEGSDFHLYSFSKPLVNDDENDMHQDPDFLGLMRACRSKFSTWTKNGEGGLLDNYFANNKDSDSEEEEVSTHLLMLFFNLLTFGTG